MSNEDRIKWNERYRTGSHTSTEPSPFLVSVADRLPTTGRALDVAGGAGRNALWLARRGLDVTLADVSDEALAIAERRAADAALALRTVRVDLECDPLPPGPWDVIVWILYLQRSLFAAVEEALAPGGLFVFLQPTTTNLERHERPPRAFLLEPGEIASLVSGLEILTLEESWSADGVSGGASRFHEARVLARKPVR